MSAEVTHMDDPEQAAGAGLAAGAPPPVTWSHLASELAEWGWGLLACLAAAAVCQGMLSAFPVLLWWSVPAAVSFSAVLIAAVGLRYAPPWGPVFAACLGLLADAAGPALLGATAWAYLPVPIAAALLHRHLHRGHGLTLVLYAGLQAVVQIGGTYVGLRLSGLSGTAGHVAAATTFLSLLLTLAAAAGVALALRFRQALGPHLRRSSS